MTNQLVKSLIPVALLTVIWCAPAPGQESAIRLASKQCLGCHDSGPGSPPQYLMEGSHGGDVGGSGNVQGCPACHGPSENHLGDPEQHSPDVSFGPRWGAGAAAQDAACLNCHESNTTANWRHSLHMLNNVTCTTCHDIHTGGDRVLFTDQQAGICTICHKAQKADIHGKDNPAGLEPACSDCHNPHDHESAKSEMLRNDSLGCRACHSLEDMAESDTVSAKANRYHRVMRQPNHTCVECHQTVAHAPPDTNRAFTPTPASSKPVILFYPGYADSTWLLHEHPGSQPLRQGTHCRQCHRGEEEEMGRSRAGGFEPAFREIQVSFERVEESLQVTLQWRGERNESDLALMWGTRRSGSAFNRGGCFAACHSDLAGMSLDQGQGRDKYLWDSRGQHTGPGEGPAANDQGSLDAMLAAGQFAVLWKIDLQTGVAKAATLLDAVRWQTDAPIRASARHEEDRWTVEIRRSLSDLPEHLVQFGPEETYTFGIALHGSHNPGAEHWVSLPLSFSYNGSDTDFMLGQ